MAETRYRAEDEVLLEGDGLDFVHVLSFPFRPTQRLKVDVGWAGKVHIALID